MKAATATVTPLYAPVRCRLFWSFARVFLPSSFVGKDMFFTFGL
jgi:hypothetical protein